MKKNLKKLIALLSVCCMATAVASFAVGCDKDEKEAKNAFKEAYQLYVANAEDAGTEPMTYEAWLESIKGPKGDKGDPGEKGEKGDQGEKGEKGDPEHAHVYEGEPIPYEEATGVAAGLGYKVCTVEDCGHKEWFILDQLKGIVADNPIDLAIGVPQTFNLAKAINEDGDAVLYFKGTLTEASGLGNGFINLVADAGSADVKVEYYGAQANYGESNDSLRYQTVITGNDSEFYIKLTVNAADEDGSVDVELTHTANAEGIIENTVVLSQQTASTLTVYQWAEYMNRQGLPTGYFDWQVKDYLEVTEQFNASGSDSNTAKFKMPFNIGEKYKIEVSGLPAGYVVADESQLEFTLETDGSHDDGFELNIDIVKEYAYQVNVVDANGYPIVDAKIEITDANGQSFATPIYPEVYEGTANFTLKEKVVGGETNFSYGVKVLDVPFGQDAPALKVLDPDTDYDSDSELCKVQLATTAAGTINTWTIGAEATRVLYEGTAATERTLGTITTDGTTPGGVYTIRLTGEFTNVQTKNFSAVTYTVVVNGTKYELAAMPDGYYTDKMETTIVLADNTANEIEIIAKDGAESVSAYTINLQFATIDLGEALSEGANEVAEYALVHFAPTKAGNYTFTVDSEWVSVYESESAYDNDIWGNDAIHNVNGYSGVDYDFTMDLAVGEVVTFYCGNGGDGAFHMNIAWDIPSELALDLTTEKVIQNGKSYFFTNTASTEKTYYFTINHNDTWANVNLFASAADTEGTPINNWGYNFSVTLAAGATQEFYVVTEATDIKLSVSKYPAPQEIELMGGTAMIEGAMQGTAYTFTADVTGYCYITATAGISTENYVVVSEDAELYSLMNSLYASNMQESGRFYVQEGEEYTIWVNTVVGTTDLVLTTEAVVGGGSHSGGRA